MLIVLGGKICGDVLENFQARNLRSIYVHVVDFWLLNKIQILFLCHFLLKHLGLLLVLLDTVVDAMYQDVSVNDLFLSKSLWGLLVAKTASTSGCSNSSLWLLDDLNFLGFWLGNLRLVWNIKGRRIDAHLRFLFIILSTRIRHSSRQCLLLSANIDLRKVMDELASHSIWAVSIRAVFFAELSLVENRNICLDHHVILTVGKRALL